jgi:hypothetical protein
MVAGKVEDLTGQVFGRWTVLGRAGTYKRESTWTVVCSCKLAIVRVLRAAMLKKGKSKSCGCLNLELIAERNKSHGLTNHQLFDKWQNMRGRCYNPNNPKYPRYGGRGITICDSWKDDFQAFYNWSLTNGWAPELTIDRVNNDGPYCPENCRWTTIEVQANNRSTNVIVNIYGQTMPLQLAMKQYGACDPSLASSRIKKGWDHEKAITTPPRLGRNQYD